MSRRSEYDSYIDDTDYVSIDGKDWDYRRRDNQAMIDKQDAGDDNPLGYNRHSYAMTDPLYAFSRGAVNQAAKYHDISNIDEKEEVDKIIAYLNTPRLSEEAFEEYKDSVPTDTPQVPEVEIKPVVEPEDTTLSDTMQESIDFVKDHNWYDPDVKLVEDTVPLTAYSTDLSAGIKDELTKDFLGRYKLNLVAGAQKAGIPTRGPGAPGTPGGFRV